MSNNLDENAALAVLQEVDSKFYDFIKNFAAMLLKMLQNFSNFMEDIAVPVLQSLFIYPADRSQRSHVALLYIMLSFSERNINVLLQNYEMLPANVKPFFTDRLNIFMNQFMEVHRMMESLYPHQEYAYNNLPPDEQQILNQIIQRATTQIHQEQAAV